MKKYLLLTSFAFLISNNFNSFAQYSPTSPYLQNAALAIGYADSCAKFWLQTWDIQRGGFYTNINKDGSVITNWGTNKNMLTQARNSYGMVRAYMLTGDTTYLGFAKGALNWMYNHAWDTTYGGWYQDIDINGNPINPYNDKTAFYQHYAMLGIIAYYEATGDTIAWNWLMKSYQHLENYFWDNRSGYQGYYDLTDYSHQNSWNKSFNATVDAITTHLLYLYLLTKDNVYKDRLQEIAEEIKQHLVASMPQQAIGFVEKYDSDWNWDNGQTMTIMGHVLKTGWCLARINQLLPDTSYVTAADNLIKSVWQKGYDHQYGGPYKDFNRTTGEMLLWGLQDSAKAWWQMEQAITAGLEMYNTTGQDWYLLMADETLNFYMQYFVDHQYGEVYADRTRYGEYAWNEAKGSSGKAGYHSIETGYYTYLYGNLFYTHQPIVLNYNFESMQKDREILLTPLAIRDSSLAVSRILLNGQVYANYNSTTRVLNLPSGVGGHFEITYAPVITSVAYEPIISITKFELAQNYPNPFNPSTKIKYLIPSVIKGGGEGSKVQLKVHDVLGNEVVTLVDEFKPAGSYTVEFNASNLSSGVYFYKLQSGNFIETKKMILLR